MHREHQVERPSLGQSWQLGLVAITVLSISLMGCGAQQEMSGRANTGTPSGSHDTPPPAAPGGHPSPLLSANFALLRTPPDGIPLAVRQAVAGSVPGVIWDLARRIQTSLPSKYWLVPGPARICVMAAHSSPPSTGTVCAGVSRALRHGIMNTSLDPISGRRTIVGVTPKGTRSVLIQSGASTTSVRVHDGRFVLRDSVSAPPDQVTLR